MAARIDEDHQGGSENMASLAAAKAALRTSMTKRLARIPAASIAEQSRNVLSRLQHFTPYVQASRVSIFLSMPSGELQTIEIVRHALSVGKEVYVPYLHKPTSTTLVPDAPKRVMDMVKLHGLEDYENLKADKWGIPSVDPGTIDGRQRILGSDHHEDLSSPGLDLVLIPGVAFSRAGEGSEVKRLGHGKGFYDFFFQRYGEKVAAKGGDQRYPPLIALALTEQLLGPEDEDVPVGPLDRPLDGIVIGTGEIISSNALASS